jgi:hypothetical protein
MLGKNTPGYINYLGKVPKEKRKWRKGHLHTPSLSMTTKKKRFETNLIQLKESNKKMVGMPDFSKEKIIKAYNAYALPNGIKMEEDGWIAASARSVRCWINLSINGMKILNEGLIWDSGGYFYVCSCSEK